MDIELYDKTHSLEKKELQCIRKSGTIAILCGVVQASVLFIFVYLAFFSVMGMGFSTEIFNLIVKLSFPILAICINILQIYILFQGLRILVEHKSAGTNIFKLNLFFLIIYTISIPISIIFFWDVVSWFPYGFLMLNLSFIKLQLLNLVWCLFIILLLAITNITFGFLLFAIDREYLMMELKIPALFFLLQIVPFLGQIGILFDLLVLKVLYMYSVIFGILIIIAYFLLGFQLRKAS